MILTYSFSPVLHKHASGTAHIIFDEIIFFYDNCMGMKEIRMMLKAVGTDSVQNV